jgi:hypothetical protein
MRSTKIKGGVICIDDNSVPELLRSLISLGKKSLKVGIKDDEPSFVQMLATVHEYGCSIAVTPKMRGWFRANYGINLKTSQIVIPERSFLRKTWDDQEQVIEVQGVKIVEQLIASNLAAPKVLGALGAVVSGLVRARIAHGDPDWPALSDFTVGRRDATTRPKTGAANRAKQRKSDTPLNNTGQNLRANIRWWLE